MLVDLQGGRYERGRITTIDFIDEKSNHLARSIRCRSAARGDDFHFC